MPCLTLPHLDAYRRNHSLKNLRIVLRTAVTIRERQNPRVRLGLLLVMGSRAKVGLVTVDAVIQSLHQTPYGYPENFANTEQRRDRDGPSRFDLLPMSRRKTERNHVLLREAALLSQATNSLPQRFEEYPLLRHAPSCSVPRAKTPRAD